MDCTTLFDGAGNHTCPEFRTLQLYGPILNDMKIKWDHKEGVIMLDGASEEQSKMLRTAVDRMRIYENACSLVSHQPGPQVSHGQTRSAHSNSPGKPCTGLGSLLVPREINDSVLKKLILW